MVLSSQVKHIHIHMVFCYKINKLAWLKIMCFNIFPLSPQDLSVVQNESFVMKQLKIGKCSPIYILLMIRKKNQSNENRIHTL